ncbi:MAG: ArsR family transcriptional regulator [Planctomycetes bacterium]|nr:ArsR family transcriptional regulator [Planctomycetota bacterium]
MDRIDLAVRVLRAAGDATRARILVALLQRSPRVCEVVALVDVGLPAVWRHPGILQDAGLVESVRDYRQVDVEHTDLATMADRGLLRTPTTVVDGETIVEGRVLLHPDLEAWLAPYGGGQR